MVGRARIFGIFALLIPMKDARFIIKRATGSRVRSEGQAAGVRALRNAMQAAKKRPATTTIWTAAY